ncbi:MAG: PAS domain S-box protein [Desulfuromusa sp.]|nr:PAS domain S-box protein [Desulfuromusa sp.]
MAQIHDDLTQKISTLQEENQRLQQSLQAVQDSSDRCKDLIEFAADAIFMGDPAGNIIDTNQSAAILSGYSYAELVDMNLGQLFTEAEQQRAPLRYDLLKQGETVKTERILSRKDGNPVPVEMHSRMMPDGSYHSFMRDISERKQADEALRISEEKFSQAFKLCPDAITLSRLVDGTFLEVNQGFSNIIGWTHDEVINRSARLGDLDIWAREEDREQFVSTLRQHGEIKEIEISFRHKNGQFSNCLVSARTIEINAEPCMLSIIHDISERKKDQEKQKQLEEQLLRAQKLESLGVLAGGIAHDFNNILMAVIGHCELAQRRLTVESPAMENLHQIKLATSKAADLSNQMLAYSGKGKFIVEPLNLSLIVEEMEQILAVSSSKKATLRYDLAPDLPSFEADATQLRQILVILVINASDAIGEDSGVIAISSGVMDCDHTYLQQTWLNENLAEGRYVFIEVADTGCGMSPETLPRIFEPFFSTKFTGRGLGMAAVLGIVRGHSGAIKIYTEVGKGSTFKILLPASTLLATKRDLEIEDMLLQTSGLVLLVDDEETVRDIGKEMLGEFGFETVTACDGKEALDIFKQQHNQISFVLMDLTLPRMN